MNNHEREKWETSRTKYWLDIISNVVLTWCACMVVIMLFTNEWWSL